MMSFVHPCDVSDDVIPDHVRIGTCDMLSVFRCIRFTFGVSMLCTGCYVKQMKSKQFLNPSSITYERAQVNSSSIANIC